MTDRQPFKLRVGKATPFWIEDSRLYHQESPKQKARSSCLPISSSCRSVPLYNVLGAKIGEGSLQVSLAVQSGGDVKLRTWSTSVDLAVDANNGPWEEETRETTDPHVFKDVLLKEAYNGELKPKRAYVLVNPNAGPAVAVQKWQNDVRPLFEAAQMVFEWVKLTRGGEATDLVKSADLTKYDTIVALSGDGTPHEIFNGLAQRPDASQALQSIAVSHIPCGSGNAMAYNLYGTSSASQAALDIIKGQIIPMDLMSVTQENSRIVSFLTQTLGIVAESDLGTENWRWMGSTRFDLGIGLRAFQQKCYPCDVAVKLEVEGRQAINDHYRKYARGTIDQTVPYYPDVSLPPLKYGTVTDELPEGWEMVSHDNVNCLYVGKMAWITRNDFFFRAALPTDGLMDLMITRGDVSPLKIIKTLMDVGRDPSFNIDSVGYKKISAYRVIPRKQEAGFISVDGESVPFKPFQVEVHRGLARVVAKTDLYMHAGPPGWDNVDGDH